MSETLEMVEEGIFCKECLSMLPGVDQGREYPPFSLCPHCQRSGKTGAKLERHLQFKRTGTHNR